MVTGRRGIGRDLGSDNAVYVRTRPVLPDVRLVMASVGRPHHRVRTRILPDMSGIDAVAELRRDPEQSGCVFVAVAAHGKEYLPSPSPFDQHFVKPTDPASLLDDLSGLAARRTPPSRA